MMSRKRKAGLLSVLAVAVTFSFSTKVLAQSGNSHAVAMYNLGLNAYKQGSPESAIIFFKRACDIDPNLADAQYNLGMLFQSERRLKEAVPHYLEVLRVKPTDPDAHYQLALCYIDLGQGADARVQLQTIAPNNPHFADAQKRLALIDATSPTTPNSMPAVNNESGNATMAASNAATIGSTAPPAIPSITAPPQGYTPPPDFASYSTAATQQAAPPQSQFSPPQTAMMAPPAVQQSLPTAQQNFLPPGQQPQQSQQLPLTPTAQEPMTQTPPQNSQPSPPNLATLDPAFKAQATTPVPALSNCQIRVIASGFEAPAGLAFDRQGNLYVANFLSNTVERINADGSRAVFSSGANLKGPIGLVVDGTNNLYVANYAGGTVARISPAGVSTVIGTGFRKPYYLTLDKDGNLFVSQQEDNSIVRISLPKATAARPQ